MFDIKDGLFIALLFIVILSAPDLIKISTSFKVFIPPPTVKGIFTFFAIFSNNFISAFWN